MASFTTSFGELLKNLAYRKPGVPEWKFETLQSMLH